jgi:hypothetical protein
VEVGECWEWATPLSGHKRRKNPEMRVDGEQVSARRYAFEQARGPIYGGWVLAPMKCNNPYCLNPAHQVQMTRRQRIVKAAEQGTMSGLSVKRIMSVRARGKLTIEKAREIRASTEPTKTLAARYGVDKSLIGRVRSGHDWRELSSPFAGLM